LDVTQEAIIGDDTEIIERKGWPESGEIAFNKVEMKYRPDTEVVLHGLDFKIEAGEKIGIVGRTGAGKSTISVTLSRIVELLSGSI
jgi:ABC-type multidrug transport system fused ATPase/permease subunit